MRLQFQVRTLLIIVGFAAFLFAFHRWCFGGGLRMGWWNLRPYLNLAYTPLIAWIVVHPTRLRRLTPVAVVACFALLVLWADLRRPDPNQVILGELENRPLERVRSWLHQENRSSRLLFRWLVDYGTILDLISLIGPPVALPLLASLKTPRRPSVGVAVTLCLVRILDWLTAGCLKGAWSIAEQLNVYDSPIRAATRLLHGQTGAVGALASLTWVKGSELLVLSVTLGCLVAVLVRDRT
jgi:hypothetical protein